jgi:uncharacterized protein (TIGR02452 family)
VTDRLRAVAEETLAIVRAGGYRAANGVWVDLAGAVAAAADGTRQYLPDDELPEPSVRPAPLIEVTGESTLAAGHRLGQGTAALVFASARNPGGGFLRGAKAQEEDIARCSALHVCLSRVPQFYAHHRAVPDLRYSDRVVYSPAVPVFRSDTLSLLDEAYPLSMLTAAAPNLGAILTNQPELAETVPAALRMRAERVLRVAAAHGYRRLVLGAWGCGVFGNSPRVVAATFADALRTVPAFDHVVFAVLDRNGATRQAFTDALLSS